MSNDMVSHQFPVSNNQIGQLETFTGCIDSSIQMGLMGPVTNEPSSNQVLTSGMQMGKAEVCGSDPVIQQISPSNIQTELLDSMSNYLGSQILPISYQKTGQTNPQAYNHLAQSSGDVGSINGLGSQHLSIKRKAPIELMSNSSSQQNLSMPNKRMAEMENRPWLQQVSSPNKKVTQGQSSSNSPRVNHTPMTNRKTMRLDSVVSKPGPPTTPKGQPTQMQPSPKSRNESFESVRSKMRESLASALAMVTQQHDVSLNGSKGFQYGSTSTSSKNTLENSQTIGSVSVCTGATAHASEGNSQIKPSNDECSVQDGDSQLEFQTTLMHGNTVGTVMCENISQLSSAMPQEDVSINATMFAKDELLQGNGLSWVFESVTEGMEKTELQICEAQKSEEKEGGSKGQQQPSLSPQLLALEIEVELFKFFGGVNKKYKEKGRSLLFNLKDRSNPDLREKVVSGEISAERLCSMSAEELASKELSEWRQAKAEEMAQMVVLPDSEVDIRRLVKKTHKGEFQVEVDPVDSDVVEVAVGSTSLGHTRTRRKESEFRTPAKSVVKKDELNDSNERSNQQDQGTSSTITIPSSDGTDLLQGFIVDDEMKDAEFLPSIVSLDEFMESLDSEPPFQNLPVDPEKARSASDKDSPGVSSKSKSSAMTSGVSVDKAAENHNDTARNSSKSHADTKSSGSDVKTEPIWEGLLQPTISATTPVFGFFRSGEKTSTKEWPDFLEIKGRVRLDAFEKFLQELPMSRSRAVMVMHMVCKEGSPKSEHVSLTEVSDSYVLDGRVGFAEPAPGVELYLCPPHAKTLEMLSKILLKEQLEAINGLDNGLIGVVVWRRPHLTVVSPNATSHHKHTSKKHHTSSRRHQEKDTTSLNVNFASKSTLVSTEVVVDDDDDDDVPPGFGPGAAREEDDLPEFNFVGRQFPTQTPSKAQGSSSVSLNPHPQTPSLAVNQMRELIQKYGRPENVASTQGGGLSSKSWKDDDDDDIPEWQPHTQLLQPQPHPISNFHPNMNNQVHSGFPQHQPIARPPVMPMHPHQNVMQNQIQPLQQGARWLLPNLPFNQPNGDQQYYGTPPPRRF